MTEKLFTGLLSIKTNQNLAIFCGCTARFVSDLVENPEDMSSRDAAHIMKTLIQAIFLRLCRLFSLLTGSAVSFETGPKISFSVHKDLEVIS